MYLGKWLRKRYENFLPDAYSENDIIVQSTDVDRTLMSAEANMAGLYPPQNKQLWDKDLKWQPIPIHTIPEIEDCVLAAKKKCAKYDKLYKELFRTPYFRNISHQLHDLYAYMSKNAGKTISDLENLEYLYNTLMIEANNNFSIPLWAQKIFPAKIEQWAFLSFATQTYTTELAKLKVGPLFDRIITFFKNHTTPNASTHPKALIFSAHDTTIANVLNAMGAFEYHSPPYAATILLEQKRSNEGRTYINIFYKNTTEPRQISLKTCDFNCDLEDFVSILKPVTVSIEDWEAACKLTWTNNWPLSFETNVILICVLIGVALLSTAILVGLKQSQKDNESDYVQLPNEEYA